MGNRRLWTTKDGTKIRIKDMSDNHLINTIKMMGRKACNYVLSIPYPNFQGEMAQMSAEQEFEGLIGNPEIILEDIQKGIYRDMLDEAKRRDLKINNI